MFVCFLEEDKKNRMVENVIEVAPKCKPWLRLPLLPLSLLPPRSIQLLTVRCCGGLVTGQNRHLPETGIESCCVYNEI